LSYSY